MQGGHNYLQESRLKAAIEISQVGHCTYKV